MNNGVDKRINAGVFSIKQFLIIFLIVMVIGATYAAIYTRQINNAVDGANMIVLILLGDILFSTAVTTILLGLAKRYFYDKPIRRISEAARKVAEGDFTIRLEPFRKDGKKDEIEVLVEDFNTMIQELSTTETLKSDFIANVSHEIKSPLAVIQSYATVIQDDELSAGERREYSKTIVDASKRLSNLITNILKINKLENQGIFPEVERFSVSEQLRECVLAYEGLWSKKNILMVGDDIEEIDVVYDKSLLEIVWNNLLANSIKFTGEGGTIVITLQLQDGFAVMTISDTGCGMDEDTLIHIFDKFYQGDSSHATEGNGLGLALVGRVIQILQGKISVKSKLGKGSTFTVILPIK